MNKKISFFLATMMTSFVAMASPCDHSVINVIGPEHYQHTIKLSAGTFNEKNNDISEIYHQLVNPNGDAYYVFSGRGTSGHILGTANFVDVESKESVSIAFQFYKTNASCLIVPELKYVGNEKFQVQAKRVGNDELIFKIREFK